MDLPSTTTTSTPPKPAVPPAVVLALRCFRAVVFTLLLALIIYFYFYEFLAFFDYITLLELKILAGAGALGGLISHFFISVPAELKASTSLRRPSEQNVPSNTNGPAYIGEASLFRPNFVLSDLILLDGSQHISGGFLASMVTGIGGAWGVLFVLAKTMNLGSESIDPQTHLPIINPLTNLPFIPPNDALTIVGLGVVAGFSASAILKSLATRLTRQFSDEVRAAKEEIQDKANDEVRAAKEDIQDKAKAVKTETVQEIQGQVSAVKTEAVQEIQGEASAVKTEAVQKAQEAVKQEVSVAKEETFQKAQGDASANTIYAFADIADAEEELKRKRIMLNAAEEFAQRRLHNDAANPETMIAYAYVKKRLATISATDAERKALLSEAIKLCSDVLQLKPDLERAYYNRACYRALLGEESSLILDDMKKAIELMPEDKKDFLKDKDLEAVLKRPEIAALLA